MKWPTDLHRFTRGEIEAYLAERGIRLQCNSGHEWRGRCPIHQGERDSFTLNVETGHWYCHSECSRGGGLVDLELGLCGGGIGTAIERICSIIGRPGPEDRVYHKATVRREVTR